MKNATSGGPDHARHLGPLARGDWGDRAYLLDLRVRNLVADVADNPVVIANVFGVAPQNADLVSQVRDFRSRLQPGNGTWTVVSRGGWQKELGTGIAERGATPIISIYAVCKVPLRTNRGTLCLAKHPIGHERRGAARAWRLTG